jgi:hypothetical protein
MTLGLVALPRGWRYFRSEPYLPAMPATDLSDQRRANLLNIRASAAEREQLRRSAAERGLTVSGLIRQALAAQGVPLER